MGYCGSTWRPYIPALEIHARPCRPFDPDDDSHQEARSHLEAEREYDAWQAGESYCPIPTRSLAIVHKTGYAYYLTYRVDGTLSDHRVLVYREDD